MTMEKKTIEDIAGKYVHSICKYTNEAEPFAGFIHTAYIKGASYAGYGDSSTGLTFSQALNRIKEGWTARRRDWDYESFVWLKPATMVKEEWCKDEMLKELAHRNQGEIFAQGVLCVCKGGYEIHSGYVPSQDDMMTDDWCVYQPKSQSETV